MASCTQCNQSMGMTDASCHSCGYDFPKSILDSPFSPDIKSSSVGDVALMAGAISIGLAGAFSALYSLDLLLRGEWLPALVAGPMAVSVSAALVVVFARTQSKGSD